MKLKKKNLSEKLIKKTGKGKTLNPFEIHVNKQKFDVLGRKSKNDRGLPGIARAKSIKKRKETLLQEYKVKDKANRFVDRRIGENNSAMTQEDRVMARYTAERMKAHNKKTMFNLADDEILTHRGKTLSEIEKYDNPGSDEEEEFDSRGGGLEADIVEAHFGGGLFHEKGDGAKTHASLIDELIAESKKRKAERQKAKEQTLELTDKLDADWHELLPLVNTGKNSEDIELKPQKGSYDQIMRELRFESRGVPSDRLKNEDELAKEEKEKLEKLEEERLRRMRGLEHATVSVPKHRSADDLDDGFDIESEVDDENLHENTPENNAGSSEGESDDESNTDEEEVEEEEEEEEENKNTHVSESNDRNKNNLPKQVNQGDKNVQCKVSDTIDKDDTNDARTSENDSCDEGNSGNEDSDSDDDLSDLKNLSENEGQDGDDTNDNTVVQLQSEKFIDTLKVKKEQMERARKELPYTFKLPENYEELESIMEGHSINHQAVIIERMIKCHHPSLGENNKQKLEELFAFLLQFLNDADDEDVWKRLDRLAPHLFDLAQFSPENSARCLLEVLNEKHEDFKMQPHRFPKADTLVFLKLVPLLFPTSDIRHQVTTPAFIFLSQLLNQCKVHGRRFISTGLFIVTIMLESTALSKRYSPEALNFLQGILEMAVPDVKVSLPYCKAGYHPLILESSCENKNEEDLRLSYLEISSCNTSIDDSYRLRALNTTIQLLSLLSNLLESVPSFKVIFSPIADLLKKLEVLKYPLSLKCEINSLQIKLDKLCNRKLQYVVLERKKPKALRLYEPSIEKVIEGKKRKDVSAEKAEQQKLLAKYKREMKGALREIRRDNEFLAKIKLRNQAKSDEERKRKVKQIYSWGAAQEGEFNKLKKRKKT